MLIKIAKRNELNQTLSRKHYPLLVFLFIYRGSFNHMLSLINRSTADPHTLVEIYGAERQLRGEDGGRGEKNSIILTSIPRRILRYRS